MGISFSSYGVTVPVQHPHIRLQHPHITSFNPLTSQPPPCLRAVTWGARASTYNFLGDITQSKTRCLSIYLKGTLVALKYWQLYIKLL